MRVKNFDYDKARSVLDERVEMERKRNAALAEKAKRDFDAVLNIVRKYNPERVYQWGSLVDTENFNGNSDIDIAVEGIESAEAFFALHKEAEEATDFTLDLVQLEKIEPEFRNIIKSKGRLVYEINK
ncbi:MAG: nucleotidyltransferase domain-containing protein [Kiritimatiellaeota bacterium]|nr:nucleotidyltransferase domain-containing protein [Kiritimatiellota bacterium]